MGDDSYHNGAFMLAHRFNFYMGFRAREAATPASQPAAPSSSARPDGYDFYLEMGEPWPTPTRSTSSTSSRCGT